MNAVYKPGVLQSLSLLGLERFGGADADLLFKYRQQPDHSSRHARKGMFQIGRNHLDVLHGWPPVSVHAVPTE